MAKMLEKDSKFNKFDVDGDGIVTDEEMRHAEEMIRIENEDKKQDAQRNMAWIAALSMPIFAIIPLFPFVPADRLTTLAAISDMLFLSQASIVGMFFGAQAYMAKK
jgi:hypothetical protein